MGGAKNCPETPRQRMIGMMYLVLTAMLALNVSAAILNGYLQVDESLHATIETTESGNKDASKPPCPKTLRKHRCGTTRLWK